MRVIIYLLISISLFANDFGNIIKSILYNLDFNQSIVIYTSNNSLFNYLSNNGFKTINNCKKANLIIIKYKSDIPKICHDKYIFGLRYDLLDELPNTFGVFFWKKGRANIVIIEPRVKQFNIKVSDKLKIYLEIQHIIYLLTFSYRLYGLWQLLQL